MFKTKCRKCSTVHMINQFCPVCSAPLPVEASPDDAPDKVQDSGRAEGEDT